MRILVHDFAGHAFQVQLSRELARRGYEVIHLFSGSNPTPKGPLTKRDSDPPTFTLESIRLPTPYMRYSFVRRWRHEMAYGRSLAQHVALWKPDVAISCNTPLDPQRDMSKRCRELDIPVILWLQDLLGLAASKILRDKVPVFGRWIGKYYISLEQALVRASAAVVVISDDFGNELARWGVPQNRIMTIENWAPLDDIVALPRDNRWARDQGLVGALCFLYAGMMGLKHDGRIIYQLAEHFRGRPKIKIVVVSQGLGADWLKRKKKDADLENLRVLDFQPYERLSEVLASADVLLASLTSDAGVFSVPSKILSYLCAGRAILASMPMENLATQTIFRADAGLVVDPGQTECLLRSADRLATNQALRDRLGDNGRLYAERTFDIQSITDRFEEIIRQTYS